MSETTTNEPLNPTSLCLDTQNESATNKETTKSKVDDVLSDSSYDSDLAASSDDDSDSEFDPNYEIVDEDDVDDVHVFSYDQDDLEIKVGVVFSDTKECKSAVLHHVVLHDHVFHTIKINRSRFTARCMKADEGCPWWFHASTGKGYIRCKVNCDMFYLFHSFVRNIDWIFLCYRQRQVILCASVVQSTSVVTRWHQTNGWSIERLIC
jgi:hypothetical protein